MICGGAFRRRIDLIAVMVSLAPFALLAQDSTTQRHRIVPLGEISGDVEILYGNPEAAGEPFVMRIRELAGGVIPPHRHPVDEHITVVQGTLHLGIGEKFDRALTTEIRAGGYVFIPKGTTMFGFTPEAAIVQVHGVGPFHIHWRAGTTWREKLRTLDDADSGKFFKFKKGELVTTPRGAGRIRQGYDSGEVIGYEIDGIGGELYMAVEADIRSAQPIP